MAIEYGNSWVEIANRALARLSKGRIDSLTTGGGEMAQYCNTFLGEAIEAILSAHPWSIATRVQLARDAAAPAFGFLYSYPLPVDTVNTIKVETDGSLYKPEGSAVLTDSEYVYIVYVKRPDDPGVLPGYLKRAITTQLAFLLSSPLTSSQQLASRIAQEAAVALEDAVRADARRFQKDEPEAWYDEAR